MIHTTSQPSTNIPPPAEQVMRATFPPSHSRQSTPVSSSQQLDAATPRQNALNLTDISLKLSDRPEDSGPIIYESASRAPGSSSQEVPIFTAPPSREPLRSMRSRGEYTHPVRTYRYVSSHQFPIRPLVLIRTCRALPGTSCQAMACRYSSCDRISTNLLISEFEQVSRQLVDQL